MKLEQLHVDDEGWVASAEICRSPHFDSRPSGTPVDLLVIHAISLPPGEYGGGYIRQFFQGRLPASAHPYFESIADMRVSSHFLIERNGHLVQFVSTRERAWHAGASVFMGRERCNDFSIGVEMEGCDGDVYTHEQYVCLAQLSAALQKQHPALSPERTVGHSDIAPGRKTDPGMGFDWRTYMALWKDMTK